MISTTSSIVFSTPRLIARRLQKADTDELLAVYGDESTVRWIGNGAPLTRRQCEEWVDVTHRNYATRGYGMYCLTDLHSGRAIGFAGLVHPGQQQDPELKYALRRSHWGRGLATEAARGVIDHGAAAFAMRRIVATIAPENEASRRVLDKIGMQFVQACVDRDDLPTHVYAWEAAATSWAP